MANTFYYGWFNLASLILGVIAWILPVISIGNHKKKNENNWIILSITSMSACILSLWFQIIYNHHLVEIGDWSALMDTTGALVLVSGVLISITMILNIAIMLLYKNKE